MTAPPDRLFYDPVSGQTFLTGPGVEYVPLAKLSDPVIVHLNMLRGTIAKPTFAQIAHIYGDEWTAAIAAAEVRGLRKAAELVRTEYGLSQVAKTILALIPAPPTDGGDNG